MKPLQACVRESNGKQLVEENRMGDGVHLNELFMCYEGNGNETGTAHRTL